MIILKRFLVLLIILIIMSQPAHAAVRVYKTPPYTRLLNLMNLHRIESGISTRLVEDNYLNYCAQNHAIELATTHTFHYSELHTRYSTWTIASERLIRGKAETGSLFYLMQEIKHNYEHNKNLLEPRFAKVGIGFSGDIWVLQFTD